MLFDSLSGIDREAGGADALTSSDYVRRSVRLRIIVFSPVLVNSFLNRFISISHTWVRLVFVTARSRMTGPRSELFQARRSYRTDKFKSPGKATRRKLNGYN